jgi:hypothetical protein
MPVASALILLIVLAAPEGAARDRAFWVSLVEHQYAVPEGLAPFDLIREMNDLVGSTDPVLRDDVAYSAAARWIYSKRLLTPGQQREVLAMWLANLSQGLGERGTDSVFRRSLSALNL